VNLSIPVPQAYLEVRVDVPSDLVDIVCDYIIENIANGIVLEEEEDSACTGVIFYVPEDAADFEPALNEFLSQHLSGKLPGVPGVRRKRIENVEWLDRYRESIKPVLIYKDVLIRPGWVEPQGIRYEIVLDPKMAFGTGTHPTTRSCLIEVREHFQSGMRFLDMGCGSGILSILADKMGAAYVKAVDYDLAAVENCRENFQINEVTTPHEIVAGSIEKCQSDAPYEFVCANIIRSTILSMLPKLLRLTTTGGYLVLSGLLAQDESAIRGALEGAGQTQFDIRRDEEWLTFTVKKR
jgi:ribosomal protein L11 methyltransferase